jgi:hypothetical protein
MCGNCHNITFWPTANYEANLIYNVRDVTNTAVRIWVCLQPYGKLKKQT